jgi:hypothetical protein
VSHEKRKRNQLMNRITHTLTLTLAIHAFAAVSLHAKDADAQPTAFTYWGELVYEGKQYEGTVDLAFTLFGAREGGEAIGETLYANQMPVHNGLFVVDMDFGVPVFIAEPRWLEITVNDITLHPRHRLNPRVQHRPGTDTDVLDEAFIPGVHDPTFLDSNDGLPLDPSPSSHPSGTPLSGLPEGSPGAVPRALPDGPRGFTPGGSDHRDDVGGPMQSSDDCTIYCPTTFIIGNVGIGTSLPTSRLEARDNSNDRVATIWNTSSSGVARGLFARSDSPNGRGIEGRATATSGFATGLVGIADSTSGRGIWGWATSTSGSTRGIFGRADSTSGIAISGLAISSTGTNYGLLAETNSPDGYAGFFRGGRNYFEGNVGIGIQSPQYPLHVIYAGAQDMTTAIAGEATSASGIVAGVAGRTMSMQGAGVAGYSLATTGDSTGGSFYANSNIGQGVYAEASHTSGTNYGIWAHTMSPNGYAGYFTGGRNYLQGNTGIGTSSPGSFKLAVDGDAAKPGGGTWSVFSDARLKRNVQPMPHGMLDRLLTLHGYTFEYHDEAVENRLALPGEQIGLIAQEVANVFPDWVDEDDDGYLYVTERGLTAIIVEALRDLRDEKDAEIEQLRGQNATLQERLAALEALVHELSAELKIGDSR